MRTHSHRMLAGLVLALLVLAGCGADEASVDQGEAMGAESDAGPSGDDGVAQGPSGPTGGEIPDDRDIIRNGDITLAVPDVEASVRTLEDLVREAGGFLGSTELRTDPMRASLVLRIPAGEFGQTLVDLRSLGEVESESQSAQDVTAEVVDVEVRIRNAQASIDRIRILLDQAAVIADVVTLESELASRVASLESLEGRRRVLADQTTLATLRVELREPRVATASDDIPGFLSGLREGWVAFLNTLQVVATIGGFLLPFGVALALVIAPLVAWRRRRRGVAIEAAPRASPTPLPPPPPGE